MTLFRQLTLLVSATFLLLFVVVSIDSSKQFAAFLDGQLKTTARDSATLLGMAISNTNAADDPATLETLFNAAFDSGYYSRLRMYDSEGNTLVEKTREVDVQGVPAWFIERVKLPEASGRASIMNGWSMVGELEIIVHPGYAYANMYQNLKSALLWFAVLFILVLVLLWCLLHMALRPLGSVKEQADAVHDNRFIRQDNLPKTLEFRSVVEAMNRLVGKVQDIFQEHDSVLEKHHELLYVDALTGLDNRRSMLNKLDNMTSESSAQSGNAILFRMYGLDTLRENMGYECSDRVLLNFVRIAKERKQLVDSKLFARMNDDEFIIIYNEGGSKAKQNAYAIMDTFKNYCEAEQSMQEVFSILRLNAGMTRVNSGDQVGQILSNLDLALAQAKDEGNCQLKFMPSIELDIPQGKMAWRDWFQRAVSEKSFYLVAQNVPNCFEDGQHTALEHRELFIRVNDSQGKPVPAGIFVPMAASLGYGREIDQSVFSLIREHIANKPLQETPYAMNLSASVFSDLNAFDEMIDFLCALSDENVSISVEANYTAYQNHEDEFLRVSELVKGLGHKFGIDHLELLGSTQVLTSIRPNYVKVNASVLGELSNAAESDGFRALRSLTRTLDIRLIAVGVENEALYRQLLALEVDAFQGNFLGEAEELV